MMLFHRVPKIIISIWFLACFTVGWVQWDLTALHQYYTWNGADQEDEFESRVLLRQRSDRDLKELIEISGSDDPVRTHKTHDDQDIPTVDSLPEDYDPKQYEKHQSPDSGECIPIHTQKTLESHPNGNTIHEMDFFSNYINNDIQYIANGGFNSIFLMKEKTSSKSLVIKSLSYFRKHDEQQFRAVRHDAIIMDRLTQSTHIFDIYGYCGSTLIVPYISGGTLQSKIKQWQDDGEEIHLDSKTRLQYAMDIAKGLRDLHDIHVIHGDLHELQYLFGEDDGKLLLSDFNKSQFLSRSSLSGKLCAYKAPYINKRLLCRSPEEYIDSEQSTSADVFAMGNLFYYILTGKSVWEDWQGKRYLKRVREWITSGKQPMIGEDILESQDPTDMALKTAFEMCTRFDPMERATAREVSDYLENVLNELNRR